MSTETPGAGGSEQSVTNQLAQLVPSFDPATDSVEQWRQKIMLLLRAWPETTYTELATRVILNTAFQKSELRQSEAMTGDKARIMKISEIVTGQFGQVDFEKKYEVVEKALFRCQQKTDESADSFLARMDVAWTEVETKKIDLREVQAYVVLRGSRLSSEDKKRVLVECGV